MSSNAESTPLLSSNNGSGSGENTSNYYFLQSGEVSDGGAEIEGIPAGSQPDAFQPKILTSNAKHPSFANNAPPTATGGATTTNGAKPKKQGFLGGLFGIGEKKDNIHDPNPNMVKQRKAPIKVEPKVFFANERTFLAWMHISIILAGASVAILAFTNENMDTGSQIYGIITLPVAVAFIVYSMYQYVRRAYMIRNKHPGPYDDAVGPTVLSIMLMLSIVCQFAIKLYSMSV